MNVLLYRRCRPEDARELPACTGPCEQGRKRCGTPEACRLPVKSDTEPDLFEVVIWPVGVIVGVLMWWAIAYYGPRLLEMLQ